MAALIVVKIFHDEHEQELDQLLAVQKAFSDWIQLPTDFKRAGGLGGIYVACR